LASLPFKDGAGRLYAKELLYSLEAGLLLASLHITASFLELFVRDLLIYATSRNTSVSDRLDLLLNALEKQYEDGTKPQWTFPKIVDELQSREVVSNSDAEEIKKFYKKVRIPIHHGLTRRFVRNHGEFEFEVESDSILDNLLFGRLDRAHTLEKQLEEIAIQLIEVAVSFIKVYAPYVAGQHRLAPDRAPRAQGSGFTRFQQVS
jgi:hypothetical protein